MNKRENKNISRKAAITIWLLLFLFFSASASYAGTISPSEKKLVTQAEGKFEYRGTVYYAYGKSIDKLKDYLAQDHLSLSAPLIRKAHRYMSDPVYIRMAAASGYLYTIGSHGRVYSEFQKDRRFQDEEEFLESSLYQNHRKEIEQALMKISAQSMKQQIVLRSFSLPSGKSAVQARHKAAETEYQILSAVKVFFTIVECLILGVLLLLSMIFWRGRPVGKKKLIKIISVALTIGIGINCCLAGLFFVHKTTLGSYKFLKETMEKSILTDETRKLMKSDMNKILIREGFTDQNASSFVYDQIFDNEYQYIFVQKLKGQRVQATSGGITEDSFLTLKPRGVNKKIAVLETEYNLRRAYRHALKLQPAGFIHSLWANVQNRMGSVMIFGMLMLLFSVLAMLRISNGYSAIVRKFAWVFGIAGALTTMLLILLQINQRTLAAMCEVLMMGDFPQLFFRGIRYSLTAETVILWVAALVLVIAGRKLRRPGGPDRNPVPGRKKTPPSNWRTGKRKVCPSELKNRQLRVDIPEIFTTAAACFFFFHQSTINNNHRIINR